MIYNNLDKIHNSTWDCGTLVLLVLFCKYFSNSYTFSYKLDVADIPPQPKKIMQLHDDVVNRDKVLTGTLNIVSGLIGSTGN